MPEALAVGFDCSAAHCAAALLSGDRVLAVRAETMAKGQAERLMPMLEEVLAEGGVTWRDLSVIGVGIGPGSFTGTRIAVAAARGLALGLGIPAVGVGLCEVVDAEPAGPAVARLAGLAFGPGIATLGEAAVAQAAALARSEAAAPAAPPDPAETATAIAGIALRRRHAPGPRPAPLYARAPDAAPARDRGPAILPG